MKNLTPMTRLTLILALSFHSLFAQASVNSNMDYELAKVVASKENKLLMLKFTAKWCLPCQVMEKNVFSNSELTEYLNEKVIVLDVDIDQYAGKELQQKYMIKVIPTVVFVNPNGQEEDRKINSMGLMEFKSWVENIVAKGNNNSIISGHSSINNETELNVNTNQPIQSNNSDISQTIDNSDINLEAENPNVKVDDALSQTLFGEFYVQLGAFSQLDNAMVRADDLDKKFGQNANITEVTDNRGNIIYKLNLGPFDTEEEADLFVQILKDHQIDALIKKADF